MLTCSNRETFTLGSWFSIHNKSAGTWLGGEHRLLAPLPDFTGWSVYRLFRSRHRATCSTKRICVRNAGQLSDLAKWSGCSSHLLPVLDAIQSQLSLVLDKFFNTNFVATKYPAKFQESWQHQRHFKGCKPQELFRGKGTSWPGW